MPKMLIEFEVTEGHTTLLLHESLCRAIHEQDHGALEVLGYMVEDIKASEHKLVQTTNTNTNNPTDSE